MHVHLLECDFALKPTLLTMVSQKIYAILIVFKEWKKTNVNQLIINTFLNFQFAPHIVLTKC